MRALIEDFRYAMRLLRKSPAFTMVAVTTLAVGIGSNTAIFTLLDQMLLRSLPIKEPKQLVMLRHSGSGSGNSFSRGDNDIIFSYPMYRDLRDRNSIFSGLIATAGGDSEVGVQWHKQSEMATVELVSGNYFDVLGMLPAVGRLLVPSDDVVQEANPVAVLSFDYWQRRFGLDPKVVNQSILINGHLFTVIGVAPPEFHSVVAGDAPAIFAPMTMKPQITPGWSDLEDRTSSWLNIAGRLRPGITREQAQAGIEPLWHSLRAEELKMLRHSSQRFRDAFLTNSHLSLADGAKGISLHRTIPNGLLVVTSLTLLMALMSCTNVGSLLLVRLSARTREISVRYALGARRTRVIQQLLAEGALLGLAGGVLGMLAAPQIGSLLNRTMMTRDAGYIALSSRPSLPVLAFNFGFALCVSVLFSLAPALQFWRPDLIPVLKQQATVIAGGAIHLRRGSVVAQIAFSLMLLAGAGFFLHTLHNLKTLDVGFTTDHLLTFRVNPSFAGYQPDQNDAIYQQILQKLSGLPGVRSVAATNDPELSNNNWGNNITIAGYHAAENEDMNVEWSRVSGHYFSTLKMPLLAGREIDEGDRAGGHKVAVVNTTFATRYFGSPPAAIGHYFCSGAGNVTPDIEIVGVVGDVKHTNLRENIRGSVFTPYLQEQRRSVFRLGMAFYVRTWQAPQSAEATIRAAMQEFDSRLVINEFLTMQDQVSGTLITERVIAFLATSFGILAALLAAIGIYGVLAYSTAQRTREIGIRVALGATRTQVIELVLAEVGRLAAFGLAIGVLLSLMLARLVRGELFGVSNYDPLTMVVVSVVIVALALTSAALPARRAAKVDPMVALRYE